jgi:hypothetical protein
VIGVILSLAVVAATVLADPAGTSGDVLFLCLWLTMWTGGVIFLLGSLVIPRWKDFAAAGTKRVKAFAPPVSPCLPFIAAEIAASALA